MCRLSGGLSQQPDSNTICGWQDSIRCLAWIGMEDINQASLCVRMLGFLARSESATKEAGSPSHSGHIRWVQHIDYAALRIRSIAQDAKPLQRYGIQRRTVVHRTEYCRRSNPEEALLQSCHLGTQTHTHQEAI